MEIVGLVLFAFVLLAAAPANATPRARRRVYTLIPENRLLPKPNAPEYQPVPPEVLAGGVPVEDGWETVGWYSYRGGSIWIRVDEAEGDGPTADMVLPGISDRWHIGEWAYRWTVVAGELTPLASEDVLDDYSISGPSAGINPEFAYTQVMATVYQHIARLASDWVDANIPSTATILPLPHITPIAPVILPKQKRPWK